MPAVPSAHELPRRKRRLWLWFACVLLGVFAVGFTYYRFVLDWDARPFCHKQVMLAVKIWMNDRGTNVFPNVVGQTRSSLLAFDQELGGKTLEWLKDYKYVAGLQEDDPGDLVLMYVSRPTRWKWHGLPQSKLKPRGWVVVPLDFVQGSTPTARRWGIE